ncbi:hypothetical protein PB2503_09969 [Parvularcula bermudensis HTCC2503]|uniref:Aminoglycoside phosphotransferase domain-containing protein n=2 Tax=Parvularcula TaxID=208215 RepID=E0TEG0_PARBH|nr:hypothetical protein PB2503_09969 [Parvularcula bermudensis HTCC2503]
MAPSTAPSDREDNMTDEIPHDLPLDRLVPWLEKEIDGFAGPVTVTKFKGGQSNPTYRLSTPGGDYVLRRKPFGDLLPSAHAVDREYRLISALSETPVPVAEPFCLCDDDDVIGSMFYVMEFVPGRTISDGLIPDATPAERGGMYRNLIETLGDLHSVDYQALGLSDFGKAGNYFERQIGRWTKQYKAAETDDIPEVERLIEFLPETVPAQQRSSIIHGDYRIDNAMFDVDSPEILAVLDWELSTIGDPMADFTYLLMQWSLPVYKGQAGLMGADLDALGIPQVNEAVAIYRARTGIDGVPDLNWYFAYNLFRLVGILQGVKKRALMGNASSPFAMKAAAMIEPFSKMAWTFAEKAKGPN